MFFCFFVFFFFSPVEDFQEQGGGEGLSFEEGEEGKQSPGKAKGKKRPSYMWSQGTPTVRGRRGGKRGGGGGGSPDHSPYELRSGMK